MTTPTLALDADRAAVAGRVIAAMAGPEARLRPDQETAVAALCEDAARVRAIIPDVPDDVIVRSLIAWTGLFGWLSFELFGQFNNTVLDTGTDRRGGLALDHQGLGAVTEALAPLEGQASVEAVEARAVVER